MRGKGKDGFLTSSMRARFRIVHDEDEWLFRGLLLKPVPSAIVSLAISWDRSCGRIEDVHGPTTCVLDCV